MIAAAAACAAVKVKVEPDLVETICENWYHSWATPGANGQWGGPDGSKALKPAFDVQQLRPAALSSAADLYLSAPQLAEAHTAAPSFAGAGYMWGRYESEHEAGSRVGDVGIAAVSNATLQTAAAAFETVLLVSHGGPCALAVEYLMGAPERSVVVGGYTSLQLLQ
eukprot:SAG22_NODE_6829_length_806_cov_1.340877_1_plen_165_part_10